MARSTTPPLNLPLGSLTQSGSRTESTCSACGSDRITELAMTLTDGTPVEFVSCHRCETKTWRDASGELATELAVHSVLDKTRKR
jgi:hypothetical protein